MCQKNLQNGIQGCSFAQVILGYLNIYIESAYEASAGFYSIKRLGELLFPSTPLLDLILAKYRARED